ncbi:MAG: tetratricopeptide repeat protein [Patescibacteria group bacterium]
MSQSPFIPRVYQNEAGAVAVLPQQKGPDKIGRVILRVEQYMVGALFLLVPVFFVPGLAVSLGFDKTLISAALGLLVMTLLGLSALRYSKTETVLPLALLAFWVVVVVAFLSGILSGDIRDALRGSMFETQTASFLAVMGLLMTIPLVLQKSKLMSLRALMFFGVGSIFVLLYSLCRIVFGADFLPLGSFAAVTLSPIGSFNDLAIFSGLTIIISLVTLLQLPLKQTQQWIMSVVVLAALAIMAIVNFFSLWLVLGFFTLLLLVYIFSRDTLFSETGDVKTLISPVLVLTTMIVCITCVVFVVMGNYAGSKINAATGINYIEVRPSMSSTLDIAKSVYSNDFLLGIGPNKFTDAWRLHKDRAINETLFWNTNFSAGFGFVPTVFVTLGILGGLAMLAFHGVYLHLGYRMLLKGNSADSFWYYFGITTFLAAVFLWMMSYVYVTGQAILLLAALFTGLSFVAYGALVPSSVKVIQLVSNRRRGFLLMVLVIVLIIVSVSAMFTMAKQYVAVASFTKARTEANTAAEFQQITSEAYRQYQDDTFLIALTQSRLVELQAMLRLENPSEPDQEKFVSTARLAVLEAEEAIKLDDGNPATHAALADVFGVLALAGFQDARDRMTAKLEDAHYRDPSNPIYAMAEASLAIRLNDTNKAREKITKALELKRNYSEALFLLSQIDVKDGKLDSAINTSRQIVTLEPNNPTRYYQLGVLLAAKKDLPAAIAAYEAAIMRDKNFANARYMLALTYLDSNRLEEALTQLRIVQETNKDNLQLRDLITQLETGGFATQTDTKLEGSVNEAVPGQTGDSVTSPTDPNTNLVSPVNTVPEAPVTNQPINETSQ